MINKSTFVLISALAIASFASPAFAQNGDTTFQHYHRSSHARRIYNSVPQATAPSPYAVENTGGGSLGYNQHDEVKN